MQDYRAVGRTMTAQKLLPLPTHPRIAMSGACNLVCLPASSVSYIARFETDDDDDDDEEDDEGSDTDYSDDDPDAEFTGEPPRLNYGPMVDYEEAVKRSWKSAVKLLGEEFMLSTKGAARHVSQRQDSVDKGADKASE